MLLGGGLQVERGGGGYVCGSRFSFPVDNFVKFVESRCGCCLLDGAAVGFVVVVLGYAVCDFLGKLAVVDADF